MTMPTLPSKRVPAGKSAEAVCAWACTAWGSAAWAGCAAAPPRTAPAAVVPEYPSRVRLDMLTPRPGGQRPPPQAAMIIVGALPQ
ncbi:hypothetical protein ACFWOJ_10175 [Streptomyces sp. NPDC058439]|uniref:hypothetical protein n=1 Tax=Streptomyces sp. NPDC058439 TaxID=3346500 RepID=UPI00365E1038